jgi:hypothetical protein
VRIHNHLLPGGCFICTLSNPRQRQKQIDNQLHLFRKYPLPQTNGTLLLWLLEKYNEEDPKVVEMSEFFEEFDSRGTLIQKRCMELRFRLSEKNEFESLLISSGFEISNFYGDYSRGEFQEETSQHMIWKCKLAKN